MMNNSLSYNSVSSTGMVAPWQFYSYNNGEDQGTGSLRRPAQQLTEKDAKVMKRKHANRESARRSKMRKKQEAEELQQKINVLGEEHAALEAQVDMMHERLDSLRKANLALKVEVEELGGNPGDFPDLTYETDNEEQSEDEESCQSSSSQG